MCIICDHLDHYFFGNEHSWDLDYRLFYSKNKVTTLYAAGPAEFCPKCGKGLTQSVTLCPKCGKPLEEEW